MHKVGFSLFTVGIIDPIDPASSKVIHAGYPPLAGLFELRIENIGTYCYSQKDKKD